MPSKKVSLKTTIKGQYVYGFLEIVELIKKDLEAKQSVNIVDSKIKSYVLTNELNEIPVFLDSDFDYFGLLVTVETESYKTEIIEGETNEFI